MEISRTDAADELKSLLRLFGSLPADMVQKYFVRNGKGKEITYTQLIQMSKTNQIYFDRASGICYQCLGMQQEISRHCAFAVMQKIMDDGETHIAKAKYPFDYIFEHNDKLYQLIDFSDAGLYKLRFRRNMDESLLQDVVPVIMLVNQKIDSLKDFDFDMRDTIIPQQDYIIASVSYNFKVAGNAIAVHLHEKNGGEMV